MLRDFQGLTQDNLFRAWHEPNVFNVLVSMATGAGKTVFASDTIQKMDMATCSIAHRQELVSQMSLALARDDIWHGIIAPKSIRQQIIRLHHETYGYSRERYNSDVRVAGVDTLANHDKRDRWLSQVGLVVQDEGHHVLQKNKWGRAMGLFPNARGLFLTAHPYRPDGHGLGRHASGLIDRLVLGPHARELINRGYLTDYDIYWPNSDIDFSHVPISPVTGEYNQTKLRAATHGSKRIVGDVVKEYLRRAAGKLGVTFAVDIEEATKIAAAYNAAGVRAEIITAKTPIAVRSQYMRQFRARILLQLVSVDCLGEGVDVPAIQVVSLARRTASFQVYAQQIGRALRPMVSESEARAWGDYDDRGRIERIAASGKPKAIVIDHVGNTAYFAQWHGRPCSQQNYTLDDRTGPLRLKLGPDSLRPCPNCTKPYERFYLACPYCEHVPIPPARSAPEWVDGDLVLMDPAVLDAMKADIARIDGPPNATFGTPVGGAIIKNHHNRQRAQATLRRTMALWGGWRENACGEDRRTATKRFYLTFGVDVMSACVLGSPEALGLELRISDELKRNNVVELVT
jgi:DNA repair protein RadD